ncbi:MAG: PEP/pyruvate-binding domain-containing protein [Desulfobacterales bacterium]
MSKKWVYLFEEFKQAEQYALSIQSDVRGLLGGKGANLAEMAQINVPVPPGFTITTEACNVYLNSNKIFPETLWEQVRQTLRFVEAASGKNFGDPKNPLLLSCRSGAKFSMPGMMDTVLNIGLNDQTVQGMIALSRDERFVFDAYRRLIQMFGNVVTGIPDQVFEEKITETREKAGVETDAQLTAEHWKSYPTNSKLFSNIIPIKRFQWILTPNWKWLWKPFSKVGTENGPWIIVTLQAYPMISVRR